MDDDVVSTPQIASQTTIVDVQHNLPASVTSNARYAAVCIHLFDEHRGVHSTDRWKQDASRKKWGKLNWEIIIESGKEGREEGCCNLEEWGCFLSLRGMDTPG